MKFTTESLYAEQWQFVFQLLPSYGVQADEAPDVAQTVWLTAHVRRETFDPELHKSPRAWLTGIVRRCAANHRRAVKQRPEVLTEEACAQLPACGLNPEQAALLRTLQQAIKDEDRLEALILQIRHGLSIAEIAAATGVTEAAIERRIHMAKEDLKAEDNGKKAGAFLGFGTLEALAEALRPQPIPDEVGAALWKRIAELIQPQEGAPVTGNNTPSSIPPVLALPPAAVPALVPVVPQVVTFTKAVFAAVVAGAFLGGAAIGAGAVLALQGCDGTRHGREVRVMEVPPLPSASNVTETFPVPLPSVAASNSSPAAKSTAAPSYSASAISGSKRLILQMRRAAESKNFALVLTLAEQHAQQFPAEHVREREAERIGALIQLGRTSDAEQRARNVATAHPQHRRAMERAAGHALP